MEEKKTLILKGKAKIFVSLQSLQSEISYVCKSPNVFVETKYFKWEVKTCPKRECHK